MFEEGQATLAFVEEVESSPAFHGLVCQSGRGTSELRPVTRCGGHGQGCGVLLCSSASKCPDPTAQEL